jgi:hypothetical protein
LKAKLIGYLGVEKEIEVDKVYPIIGLEMEEKWGISIAHLDSPNFLSSMDVLLTRPDGLVYFIFSHFTFDNDYISAVYKQYKEKDSDDDARLE